MGKLKFGCHDFLNSKPLILPFVRGDLVQQFDFVFETPAKISEKLSEGKLDAAFIPSIDYLKNKNLKLLPDLSISADGEVKSVILLSKKKIKKIKTVALDKKSKTSVVLLKILFEKYYKIKVKYLSDTKANQKKADARLMIGDDGLLLTYKATQASKGKKILAYTYDLAGEWKKFTSLPFVFAVIAVKPSVDMEYLSESLHKAKSIGTRDIADITMKVANSAGLSFKQCYDYLSRIIKYDLGEKELKGLSKFQDLAYEIGELKEKRDI